VRVECHSRICNVSMPLCRHTLWTRFPSHMERFHATLSAWNCPLSAWNVSTPLCRHTLWTRFPSHMERFHATLSAHFVDAISVLFCTEHIITTTPHNTRTQHNTTPPQRNFCVGGQCCSLYIYDPWCIAVGHNTTPPQHNFCFQVPTVSSRYPLSTSGATPVFDFCPHFLVGFT
jgi:hypothetical protein